MTSASHIHASVQKVANYGDILATALKTMWLALGLDNRRNCLSAKGLTCQRLGVRKLSDRTKPERAYTLLPMVLLIDSSVDV